MEDTSFQVRIENTLAGIMESITRVEITLGNRIQELEESMNGRMDRIEEELHEIRAEAAADRATTRTMQDALHKSSRALAVV